MEKINKVPARAAVFLIQIYQYCISHFFGNCCRFYPSCSNYAIYAVRSFGLFYGSYLCIRRLLRCHPFSLGGYDPIPEKKLIKYE